MCVCVRACVHVCVRACVCACMRACMCPVQVISLETIEVINIKLGMVTTSDMRMHHASIILTFTFIQGHTDLDHKKQMFDYFRNRSSNAHQVCCEDSPTEVL